MEFVSGPRPPVPAGPFLVVGIRKAGLAAMDALERHCAPEAVRAWDEDESPERVALSRVLAKRGIVVALGGDGVMELDRDPRPTTLVKSPGVPITSRIIRQAIARGVTVIDELELGWRLSPRPILAVTGTNGKSTVCALLVRALRAAGLRPAQAGNSEGFPPLSRLPRASAEDPVVCEVSSFQLAACPAFQPELAVLTNLRPEHVEYHGSLRAYGQVKRNLFMRDGRAVSRAAVFIDERFGAELALELTRAGTRVVTAGVKSASADFQVLSAGWDRAGSELRVRAHGRELAIRTRLPGPHNAENVVSALAASHALGLDLDASARAFEAEPGVPGRWELIDSGQPFDAVVDFAHTPDAMERVLLTARRIADQRGSRVHVVAGGGGRFSAEKRRSIATVARALSDRLTVTGGGSDGVDSAKLLTAWLSAAKEASGARLDSIADRREAIAQALGSAGPGDLVLVTGRGATTHFRANRLGYGPPFDDREVVRSELARLRVGNPGP